MKVFVYYNLHKKCWSVKALEGPQKGRVVAHRDLVVLGNPEPKVSQKGRERVLREKRKNVHAGIVGEWKENSVLLTLAPDCIKFGREITYNPYKYTNFVYKETENPYIGSRIATLINRKVFTI